MKGLLRKHPKVSILLVTVLAVLFILGYFVKGGLFQAAKADERKVVQQPVTVVQEETKEEPVEKQKTDELQKQAPVPVDTQTPSNEQQVTTSAVKAATADEPKVEAKQAPAPEPKKVEEPQSQPQVQQTQPQPPAEVKQPEAPKVIDNIDYLDRISKKEPRFVYTPNNKRVIGCSDNVLGDKVTIGNLSSAMFPNSYQITIHILQPENFDLGEIALTEFIGANNANEIIAIVKKIGEFERPKEKEYNGKTVIYYSEAGDVFIQIFCNGL